MKPESANLPAYLQATAIIDGDHPHVLAQAQTLAAGLPSDVEQARAVFEWVRDTIPHSNDIAADVVTCTASDVLRQGTGMCYAKSHLLAALLRALHIPAGFCYQVLRRDPPQEGTVLHGLNGVFLSSLKRWIRLDARGNVGDIDAQFCLTEERLAFPMDAERGEFLYDTIFVSPAPVVVEVLQRSQDFPAMWAHLPTCLPDNGCLEPGLAIVPAKPHDLPAVMAVLRACIADMERHGIHQWDDSYPNATGMAMDIDHAALYVLKDRGEVCGTVVLDEYQADEYATVPWQYNTDTTLVIHRLTVHPQWQNRGLARTLMDFAEQFAHDHGYQAIRLDACVENPRALALYERRGYRNAGTIVFARQQGPVTVYCFEKKLCLS